MHDFPSRCPWCNLSDRDKQWLLFENGSWSVFLADEQDYIGRCILVCKRHCAALSDLTAQEWSDLKQVVDGIEACPDGLEDISKMQKVIIELRKRGYSDYEIRHIAGGNFLRVLEQVQRMSE